MVIRDVPDWVVIRDIHVGTRGTSAQRPHCVRIFRVYFPNTGSDRGFSKYNRQDSIGFLRDLIIYRGKRGYKLSYKGMIL